MTQDLVFYTNPMSRGRIVRWMLEEIGAPYQTRVLEFGPPMKNAEFLALNPMGKVPVIRHGDTVITETAAILAYLADAFPAAGLAPAAGSRGAFYRWLFFAAGPLESALVNKSLNVVVPPEKQGMVGYGTYDLVIATLEKTLAKILAGKTYLAGADFSAADLYIGAQLSWGLQFGTVPAQQAFTAYWQMLESRPAYRRATELDDRLLQAA